MTLACIDGVIGVKSSIYLKDNEFAHIGSNIEKIDFIASSRHLLKIGGKLDYCMISNSYATPVITATAIDILRQQPGLDAYGVINELKKRSKPSFIYSIPCLELDAVEDDITAPVILVYLRDALEQCRLVEYLNEHFKENGYNSFCSYSSSEGENRLPQSGLLMYLLQICRFYRSDIIILGCTDRKLFSEFKSYDIIISDYDRNGFETGTYDAKFIGYPVVNTVDIFDTILRHFQ